MFRSWRIGSAFGIPINIHWSFALLLLWVVFFRSRTSEVGDIAFMLVLVLALFGCIVLHELGHALMARVFGIATQDITLYPIGGVARLESTGHKPSQELLIAVAGPAVNVAIVLILAIPLLFMFALNPGMIGGSVAGRFVLALAACNLFVVAFNMLPAFPMDGGRVLRSLLSYPMGQLKATRVATWVGGAFAILGIAVGIMNPQFIWLAIIGVFIFFAGQQELRMTEWKAQSRYNPYSQPQYRRSRTWREEDEWEYPEYSEPQHQPAPAPAPTPAAAIDPHSDFSLHPKINVYVWDEENNSWIKQ